MSVQSKHCVGIYASQRLATPYNDLDKNSDSSEADEEPVWFQNIVLFLDVTK